MILKFILLEVYQELTKMTFWTYYDWAWSMRIIVETCLREIMQLGLMRHIFDLVYSLHCGYVGGPIPKTRRAKYTGLFGAYTTTFKDAYGICVEFYELFESGDEKVKQFVAKHGQERVLEVLMEDLLNKQNRGIDLDENEQATVDAMSNQMWKAARAAYFTLKKDGQETYAFDSVFANETPPFPTYVFLTLAGTFFAKCGWIPVGDNVGLCLYENMAQERKMSQPYLMDKLDAAHNKHGLPKIFWQTWWRTLPDAHKQLAHAKLTLVGKGLLTMQVSPSADDIRELIGMFPHAVKLPRDVQAYIAERLSECAVLDSGLTHDMYRYNQVYRKPYVDTFSEADPNPPETVNTNLGIYFRKVEANEFFLKEYIKNGKVTGLPTSAASGRVTGLPFQELIDKLQELKTFFHFKDIFQLTARQTNTDSGLFLQACIDYANTHDPVVWHDYDDDYVTWLSTPQDHPLLIADKRLFYDKLPLDIHHVTLGDKIYHVTEKGTVLYAYNPRGEPMFHVGYYCKDTIVNLLNLPCFRLLGDSVHRDFESGCIELPRLEAKENYGGDEKLYWKGRELGRVDFQYWHEKLGHVSRIAVERYRDGKVVKGIPPFFWPGRGCGECT